MALFDLKCLDCGHIFEAYIALSDWPKRSPCERCGGATEKVWLPKSTTWTVDPVVVYKAPDGTFRFPGSRDGLTAGKYEKQGYERVEIRGAAEMRSFEAKMGKKDFSEASRRVERMQELSERRESVNRSELRQKMQSMSEFGKAVARAAMDRNDGKPKRRTQESGFHSEAFSYDHSNREEFRDERGRRRRD